MTGRAVRGYYPAEPQRKADDMPQRVADNAIAVRLRDGRTMCYAQYGASDGVVVVNAHGGLSCRLDVAAADRHAHAAGVRLISPDRPGVGRSDPRPGRTIAAWADDVAELLDLLGVERFAAMGWSMGGPYAAALGKVLPTRMTRVAIIAGALPLSEPRVFAQLPAIDRTYTRLSVRAPWAARTAFRIMGLAARTAPGWYGRMAAGQLGPADADVLRRDGFDFFAQVSAEALRQPDGVVEEYRAWMRPWGFAPEDLRVPVTVWGGEQDRLIDASWPGELARRIPGAVLRMRAGGHFLAHLHYGEIFDDLTR